MSALFLIKIAEEKKDYSNAEIVGGIGLAGAGVGSHFFGKNQQEKAVKNFSKTLAESVRIGDELYKRKFKESGFFNRIFRKKKVEAQANNARNEFFKALADGKKLPEDLPKDILEKAEKNLKEHKKLSRSYKIGKFLERPGAIGMGAAGLVLTGYGLYDKYKDN